VDPALFLHDMGSSLLAAMLRFGKYKGHSYEDVAARDRTYCTWVLSLSTPSPGLQDFATYLKEKHGGVLTVGAHRGAFFDEMLMSHPDYCAWAANLEHPTAGMQRFSAYLRSEIANVQHVDDEPWPVTSDSDEDTAPKRPRPAEEPAAIPVARSKNCKICMASAIRTCFVPCGHMAACVSCAARLAGTRCPICRTSIREIVKVFDA